MPKIGRDEIADVERLPGYEGRFAELGPYTVGFETYTADADLSELFKGLPDDRCQCPHWGVVLRGRLTYRTADGEVVIGAGEAYYVGPGHLPVLSAGTEVVEFSPTRELHETLEVVTKNAQEA
jgi:hypothetical protein